MLKLSCSALKKIHRNKYKLFQLLTKLLIEKAVVYFLYIYVFLEKTVVSGWLNINMAVR